MTITEQEAQERLPHWIEQAIRGEEILIERQGQIVVRLEATPDSCLDAEPPIRQPGRWAGQMVIADDFDDPLPEFEAAFADGAQP